MQVGHTIRWVSPANIECFGRCIGEAMEGEMHGFIVEMIFPFKGITSFWEKNNKNYEILPFPRILMPVTQREFV